MASFGKRMSVSLAEFQRALLALETVLALPKDDVTRDATIQRFEFTVELAWKTCRKLMGSPTTAPKDVVREMAQNGYVGDVALWLEAIDKHNLSPHTYNASLAEEVYAFATRFAPQARKLEEKLRAK